MPRSKRPSEVDGENAELTNRNVKDMLGHRAAYVYIFPRTVGVEETQQKKVVEQLGDLAINHEVGFSKVGHVERDFCFGEGGNKRPLQFTSYLRHSMQSGLYRRSPFNEKGKEPEEYYYFADYATLVLKALEGNVVEKVAEYGLCYSIDFYADSSENVLSQKELSASVGPIRDFSYGVKITSKKESIEGTAIAGSGYVEPNPSARHQSFKGPKRATQTFLATYFNSAKAVLDTNLQNIQGKLSGSYVKGHRSSVRVTVEYWSSLEGGFDIPIQAIPLQLGFRAKKYTAKSRVQTLEMELMFASEEETKRRMSLRQTIKQPEQLDAIDPEIRTFRTYFYDYFNKRTQNGLASKGGNRTDNMCMTIIGPRGAGKSSMIHTVEKAFKGVIDLNSKIFTSPPPGIVVRTKDQTESLDHLDGTQKVGVAEVEVFSRNVGVRGNKQKRKVLSLVLQDTKGLVDERFPRPDKNKNKSESKKAPTPQECLSNWFKNKSDAYYSITLVPDVFLYVLDGKKMFDLATRNMKGPRGEPFLDQANEFLAAVGKTPAGQQGLGFCFILTKADIVNRKEDRNLVMRYLYEKLRVDEPVFSWISNISPYDPDGAQREQIMTDKKLYNNYKSTVEDAFRTNLRAINHAVLQASATMANRKQSDFLSPDDSDESGCTLL